jgi:hypothetical protein
VKAYLESELQQKTTEDVKESDYNDSAEPISRVQTPVLRRNKHNKKTYYKNSYKSQLNKMEKSEIRQTVDDSIHAVTGRSKITFDAYISTDYILYANDIEDKVAYINLIMHDYKGFTGTEIQKFNNKVNIIAKFETLLTNMRQACIDFPEHTNGLHLKARRYYRMGNQVITSNEFVIFKVPESLSMKEIESALYRLVKSGVSNIRAGKNKGDILFSINNYDMIHRVKNIWSIIINGECYAMASAHMSYKDVKQYNIYKCEFTGFDHQIKSGEAFYNFQNFNVKDAYRTKKDQISDVINYFIVFENERDQKLASSQFYHYKNCLIKNVTYRPNVLTKYDNSDKINKINESQFKVCESTHCKTSSIPMDVEINNLVTNVESRIASDQFDVIERISRETKQINNEKIQMDQTDQQIVLMDQTKDFDINNFSSCNKNCENQVSQKHEIVNASADMFFIEFM